MRAIVAHRVSTVVVNTVGNLSAVNIPAGSFGVVSTGNLNAMDIRAGSSAAANIPAASTVGASMVNVEGMASIATERERQRYTLARSSPAAMPESRLGDFGLLVSAPNRTLTPRCRERWRWPGVYRDGPTLASIVSGDCAPIYVLAPRM